MLLRYRLAAGLSQEELAERAGLSRRGISDLERGVRRAPYPATVRRLTAALGLDATERAALHSAVRVAAVRHGSSGQLPPQESAAAGVHATARHNLPLQLTSFVGRVQEIAAVQRELARTRLLTLTGPGGVGKTRLALRVADAELDTFADGVWFVELAPLTEARLVPQSIATLFDVQEKPEEPLVTSLATALQPRHILLILDNCEHLLAACVDLVQRLLHACPQLVILTSSREVLGLGAETVWRVPPLGVSSAESEAAELFVERARAVQPGFTCSAQSMPAVLEICRRLEGIPLAIELAASRVGVFGLEQLGEQLATDARFLRSKDPTAAKRQQTLDNTMQWSYDLLTLEEQALFARLSVFAGGWTLDAMEAVASGKGEAGHRLLEVLERLIDKSLVQVDDVPGRRRRYRLLEPLRQFAWSRLDERGEIAATHERHAGYFLQLFEAAEQEFFKQFATPDLVGRMDSELGNLRVALRWLINQPEVERAQRLAGSSRTLWNQRAYLAEGRRWLEEALALEPPREPAARARALLGLIGVALFQGDLAVAEEAGPNCLQLLEELHDTRRLSGALGFLGQVASARADLGKARRFTEQALVATRDTGQMSLVALRLCHLSEFDLEEGDLLAAQRHAEEGLKVATAAGHVPIGCRALVNLGEVQRRLGRWDATQPIWQAALERVGEARRQHAVLGAPFITLGRQARESDSARSLLIEGLLLARDGSRWDLARGLEVVVEVAAAEDRFEVALRLAGAAAALRDRMGTPPWPSERDRLQDATTRARQRLTEGAADLAWMHGWTSPIDEAVAVALDFLRGLSVAAPSDQSMSLSADSSGS